MRHVTATPTSKRDQKNCIVCQSFTCLKTISQANMKTTGERKKIYTPCAVGLLHFSIELGPVLGITFFVMIYVWYIYDVMVYCHLVDTNSKGNNCSCKQHTCCAIRRFCIVSAWTDLTNKWQFETYLSKAPFPLDHPALCREDKGDTYYTQTPPFSFHFICQWKHSNYWRLCSRGSNRNVIYTCSVLFIFLFTKICFVYVFLL